MLQYLVVALLSLCVTVRGYGDGAPRSGCETMKPKHIDIDPDEGPSPFRIYVSATQYQCGGEDIHGM